MRLPSLCLLIALAACGSAASTEFVADPDRPWRKAGDVIDSILPMEEHIARFRAGTRELTALAGGAASPEALAEQVLASVAREEGAGLRELAVTRAEFAWLVFPDHLYRLPPYELDPALLWMQMQAESDKGLRRLVRELGGRELTFRSISCTRDTLVLRSGPATLLGNCTVGYDRDGTPGAGRLFGSIYERDGTYKLMGFANQF